MTDVQSVSTASGLVSYLGGPNFVTATFNRATIVERFYVLVLLNLFGEFAHNVVYAIDG